jgi:hypothetical protein
MAAYDAFCEVLGCTGRPGVLIEGRQLGTIRLYLGWVIASPLPEQLASAV